MSMKKDDSSLTPREKVAVLFARKLTAEPWSITSTNYDALRAEFGEQGALEVLMQVCNFAFMNRFTDGLHCHRKMKRSRFIVKRTAPTSPDKLRFGLLTPGETGSAQLQN